MDLHINWNGNLVANSMQTIYWALVSYVILHPLEITLFFSMIISDFIQIILRRTSLNLKQYNAVYEAASVLLWPESNRTCLGDSWTTHCSQSKASFFLPRLGESLSRYFLRSGIVFRKLLSITSSYPWKTSVQQS